MKRTCAALLGALILLTMSGTTLFGQEFSWQKPHAKVLPQGDLQWDPKPHTFAPKGKAVHIDYENGKDSADGTRQDPWKHHPWDPAATDKAAGGQADTYVFKGGVIYRGQLEVPAGASALLTSDPSWGKGPARIYASRQVRDWKKQSHPKMPAGQTVYAARLDYLPRNVWMVDAEDRVSRLKLARTPNWEPEDPDNVYSQWWSWDQPQFWLQFQGKNPNLMEVDGKKWHLGIDTDKLGDIGQDAVGGYVWTEWGIPTINTAYPARIRAYNAQKKGIAFGGPWFDGPGGMIFAGHRYYLEDRPQWLDQAGEFWFDRQGQGGTLYVRLPEDRDPAEVTIEAARRIRVINATDVGELIVSGLEFRFTNVLWDLDTVQFVTPEVHVGAIRLRGSAKSLEVRNCAFRHVHMGLRAEANAGKTIDRVVFNDNQVEFADQGGCLISNKSRMVEELGLVLDARVMRNRIHHVGFRNARGRYSSGLQVECANTAEIAGNVVTRTAEQGIEVYGGKRSGETHDAPLSRWCIHHNKVVDSLLAGSDWGGIETWQGGPFYVYSNISANPGGIMNWQYKPDKKSGTPRFGFAFYTDGASKNYHFNNLAVGKNNQPGSLYANNAAFQSLIGFANAKFNNTIYKFVNGTKRQGTGGSRIHRYLGNVFQDISETVFVHGSGKGDVQAAHFNNVESYDYRAMAYAENFMTRPGQSVGAISQTGKQYDSVEAMAEALKNYGASAWTVGKIVPDPLRDAAGGDYRLSDSSAAIDSGVTFFVPWALSRVVGEWHFIRNNDDPSVVIDEHWYMTEAYVDRSMYQTAPRYPLVGNGIEADSFVTGALEDWAPGAVRLNGKDQYFSLSQETLAKPYTVQLGKGSAKLKDKVKTFAGTDKKTVDMQANNFLLEMYFQTEEGHTSGGLISKADDQAGYELAIDALGRVTLRLETPEGRHALTAQKVNDGKWHHVIAQVDRANRKTTIYVDGRESSANQIALSTEASAANSGDFVVGRSREGKFLAGKIDFLRVSRGTLADARTTIQELYTWQFHGPQLKDFSGQDSKGPKRDAGAIETR